MQDKKTAARICSVLALLCTLLIWECAARLADVRYFFPTFTETARAFLALIVGGDFWKSVSLSMLRVLLGWLCGILAALLLLFPAKHSLFCRTWIRGLIAVLKSTPVASFILILWFFIGSAAVPTVISAIMTLPIVYQNLSHAENVLDPQLGEVTAVFSFSPLAKLRYYYFPAFLGFFLPAVTTSLGLAWKAGIAAEVIAYTKNSIGREILNAKNYFEGDGVFAWTLTVIVLSIILEKSVLYLGRKAEAKWRLH